MFDNKHKTNSSVTFVGTVSAAFPVVDSGAGNQNSTSCSITSMEEFT